MYNNNHKLAALLLLCPLSASAADPSTASFGEWSVSSGTITSSDTNCPVGFSCTLVGSGDGFLQQTLVEPEASNTFVQTIITETGTSESSATLDFSDENFVSTKITYPILVTASVCASVSELPAPDFIPTIELSDITLPAAGLHTEIDINEMMVVDFNAGIQSGDIIIPGVTADDQVFHNICTSDKTTFQAGRISFQSTAQNDAGSTVYIKRIFNVLPQLNLELDQKVGEGEAVSVNIHLSGHPPIYPVTIPYFVSGTASSPDDYVLPDGEVIVNSGMVGTINFSTVNDGVTGEPDENIVITLGEPSNAVLGPSDTHTVRITESNLLPKVKLTSEQAGNPARIIIMDGGPVNITAEVRDPDSADSHSVDWSTTDGSLLAVGAINDNAFSFNPSGLSSGLYNIRVSVTDGPLHSPVVSDLLLKVIDGQSLVSDTTDLISIADLVRDSDLNGIPDIEIDYMSGNLLRARPGLWSGYLLHTNPGLELYLGSIAFAQTGKSALISPHDMDNYFGTATMFEDTIKDDFTISNDVFDFEIHGLPTPGQSANIVIPLALELPDGAIYRKYTNEGRWQAFVIDDFNATASAAFSSHLGNCPSPGDASYIAGLTPGHTCIQLTIQDGGPNDADGIANGVIKDPGAVTTNVAPISVDQTTESEQLATSEVDNNTATSSGGGGLLFGSNILLLLLLVSRNLKGKNLGGY